MIAAPDEAHQPDSAVADVDIRVGPLSLARRITLAFVLLCVTLLGLFGVLYVARGSPVHGVVVEGSQGLPPTVDNPRFQRMIELHTGARIDKGNSIEILLNGNGTFPRMWRDLQSARRSITVQMYYFTPGLLADSVSKHLRDKAQAGVRVLMLLDAFGGRTLSRQWIDSLRVAGVEIGYLRPLRWYKLDRLSHRSHLRSVIVDGEIGYTGGFGFGDYWLGDATTPDEWRDTNVRMTGPAVLQLQAAFMAGWAEATGELLAGELYFPSGARHDGDVAAALLYFAPTLGSAEAERFLALTIAAARNTLFISNSYFVPDVQFRRMLSEAARRGVDVRILTAGEDTDVRTTRYAARARYEELLASGVRIYEYRRTMMHAKTFVVDGMWSAVGSLNFDNRSISYNDESNAVVLDSAFGAQMNSVFMQDLERSDEVLLAPFRKRSAWQRFMEFGANLVSGIL